jgi:hypothetical protein
MELMSSQPLMRAIRSDQGGDMEGTQLMEFITRYVAMWHEPDPRRRRAIVQGLFAEDAEDYTTQTAARGLDEINARVTRAYEEWVAAKSYVFQPTGNTDAHHHLVKFFWQMLPRSGGPIVSVGLDIFVLREDGRIRALYQFIEPTPAA